jgi:hypothetical protein
MTIDSAVTGKATKDGKMRESRKDWPIIMLFIWKNEQEAVENETNFLSRGRRSGAAAAVGGS